MHDGRHLKSTSAFEVKLEGPALRPAISSIRPYRLHDFQYTLLTAYHVSLYLHLMFVIQLIGVHSFFRELQVCTLLATYFRYN